MKDRVRRLRPSGADLWMTCAGGPNLIEKLRAKDVGNEYAAEGTFAHEIRQTCLEFGLDAYDLVGQTGRVDGFDFECDVAMAEFLQPGIDHIRSFGGHLTVEYTVELDEWMPGECGMLDAGVVTNELIVISDLKYGMGVPVQAVQNWQQIIYALGFWWNVARHISDATDILIVIDQPRMHTGGGEWRLSLAELQAYGETVKAAAEATKDPAAPRCASQKGCFWCPASKISGACPEHEAFLLSIIASSFEDLDEMDAMGLPPDLPHFDTLTPERKSFIVQNRKTFEKWLDRLHAELIDDALAGRPTPNLKAVRGRAMPMKYTNKEAAEALIRETIGAGGFKDVALTPTQIKQKFGADVLADLSSVVTQGEPKPQLVPLMDAREALTPIAELFPDLDQDHEDALSSL